MISVEERADRLRQQSDSGHPESDMTSGLVAHLDSDDSVWAVTCLVTRAGIRKRT